MKSHQQEFLRDDLYKAIDKVINDHIERGTFSDMCINGSLTVMVTNSAMKQITDLQEYYSELKDDGMIQS